MPNDLEKDKWIIIELAMSANSSYIIPSKKELQEYADDLGWELNIDKKGYVDEIGNRYYNIKLTPKGKLISPEELRKKREILDGYAVSIHRDVILKDRPKEVPKEFSTDFMVGESVDDKKENILITTTAKTLTISCSLKKAIELEVESPNLFKKAFSLSLIEWYLNNIDTCNKTFVSKADFNRSESVIKLLESEGMPKVERKKKKFRIHT